MNLIDDFVFQTTYVPMLEIFPVRADDGRLW